MLMPFDQDEYLSFLAAKHARPKPTGIQPRPMPQHMAGPFQFQAAVTEFCLRQGCAAAFLDTGLGKTSIELEWSEQAVSYTGAPALILTPLAVARQIEAEAHRFGYVAHVIRDRRDVHADINICNYDRLDLLDPSVFGSICLDESSILKSFSGVTTRALIAAFRDTPFRLCATATPAPNDFTEIGNHVEFLGIMSRAEMLARWFINDGSRSNAWRLKGHAWRDFWDWMASWSRMATSPADLGFDASAFQLPPLNIIKHRTIGRARPLKVGKEPGFFNVSLSATNVHETKRSTTEERAEAAKEVVLGDIDAAWVIWCDTDYEADALVKLLPQSVEVRGSQTIHEKETALASFATGQAKWIITKPSIAGFGLNWQHAHNMLFVGRSFSYEKWYQCIRREWRFGQKFPVNVHIIVAEGEDQIGDVIDRKASDHDAMKQAMAEAMLRNIRATDKPRIAYNPSFNGNIPEWLKSSNV